MKYAMSSATLRRGETEDFPYITIHHVKPALCPRLGRLQRRKRVLE